MNTSGHSKSPSGDSATSINTFGGCLLHLLAEFAGGMLLVVLALLILMRPAWHLSTLDVFYAVAAIALPIVQQVDAARGRAGDGAGSTVGRERQRRRAAVTLGIATVVWVLANSIQL